MLTKEWVGNGCTHMGFPLRRLPSHEGMRQAVLRVTFSIARLIVALKLTRTPAIVEGTVAATLLPELYVIIDHLIWI